MIGGRKGYKWVKPAGMVEQWPLKALLEKGAHTGDHLMDVGQLAIGD
jgi:hypothetical protein